MVSFLFVDLVETFFGDRLLTPQPVTVAAGVRPQSPPRWGSSDCDMLAVATAGSGGGGSPHSHASCPPATGFQVQLLPLCLLLFFLYSFVSHSSNQYLSGTYSPHISTCISAKAVFWDVHYLKNLAVLVDLTRSLRRFVSTTCYWNQIVSIKWRLCCY